MAKKHPLVRHAKIAKNGTEVYIGQQWEDSDGRTVKVIGIAENYAVVRRPRAVPFCIHIDDLAATWRYRPAMEKIP